MWELTKRIPVSLRNLPVLFKVEPEPGAGPLHRLRPISTSSAQLRLRNTGPYYSTCRRSLCWWSVQNQKFPIEFKYYRSVHKDLNKSIMILIFSQIKKSFKVQQQLDENPYRYRYIKNVWRCGCSLVARKISGLEYGISHTDPVRQRCRIIVQYCKIREGRPLSEEKNKKEVFFLICANHLLLPPGD